jgi:hypothetical protein
MNRASDVAVLACTLATLVGAAGCMATSDSGSTISNGADGRPMAGASVPGRPDTDRDADGLDDALEDALAERFAPIVYHGENETTFPVSVDWWLARTHLSLTDPAAGRSRMRRVLDGPLRQDMLIDVVAREGTSGRVLSSSATRSRVKRESFLLENVPEDSRSGLADPDAWITYVHSYPNTHGGITLQYWRAYVWNDARIAVFDVGHGGDWEGVAVHLNSSLMPEYVAYLQHSGIVHETGRVQWEGTHPVVFSEEGGHSSYPTSRRLRSKRTIRQETWTGGRTTWYTGEMRGRSSGLVNVGEKSHPRNQQVFVKYSGLWGSKGRLFITSGYWGPSFNETGAECADGTPAYGVGLRYPAGRSSCGRMFIKAWCDAMAAGPLDLARECVASQDTP